LVEAVVPTQDGGVESSGWRRWRERLELFALGDIDRRGGSGAAADPTSPAVLVFGGLVVTVTLYMIGAVALVQGGGPAAITVGILEIAVARGVNVPPRARVLPLIAFLFGVLTVVVGIGVLVF
jgi:hypothetical protein